MEAGQASVGFVSRITNRYLNFCIDPKKYKKTDSEKQSIFICKVIEYICLIVEVSLMIAEYLQVVKLIESFSKSDLTYENNSIIGCQYQESLINQFKQMKWVGLGFFFFFLILTQVEILKLKNIYTKMNVLFFVQIVEVVFQYLPIYIEQQIDYIQTKCQPSEPIPLPNQKMYNAFAMAATFLLVMCGSKRFRIIINAIFEKLINCDQIISDTPFWTLSLGMISFQTAAFYVYSLKGNIGYYVYAFSVAGLTLDLYALFTVRNQHIYYYKLDLQHIIDKAHKQISQKYEMVGQNNQTES